MSRTYWDEKRIIDLTIETYKLSEGLNTCWLKRFLVEELLKPNLSHADELRRSDAIEAFIGIECDWERECIEKLLIEDSSALVRASAAEALGYSEVGHGVLSTPILEKAFLEDCDDAVRGYAINSLGWWKVTDLAKFDEYLKLDLSLSVKIELLGAKYWVHKDRQDIEQMLEILRNANEHLATTIYNILEDLSKRKESTLLVEFPSLWDIVYLCPHFSNWKRK